QNDSAVTGLCTLAFLSAGHQPGRGKYGDVVKRSVDWLVDSVQRNGLIRRGGGSAGPPMYGHGFATLALAELFGMSHRQELKQKLEDAVRLIAATQNQEGGWRYEATVGDADISVTAAQVVAMRAAANAGIRVPAETVSKAVGYLKKCANNPDGGFSYQISQRRSGPARTGAAVLCLYLCGEKDSAECKGGVKYLREHPIAANEGAYRQWYFYALYYNTQANYQVGGETWRKWFTMVRERLVSSQEKNGCWHDNPGDEYATAMGVLCLQVPAGASSHVRYPREYAEGA
ncbi:MAG: terpene cyclase/mutase family protein, partial [Verrucomicrobia bacterium]|nr:terpene cyclase/mutase family protein [Verrucomicrobiota bacterium]